MPWIRNINNEKVYKPSIYTKEELPTWSEVYEEFYLKKYYDKTVIKKNRKLFEEIDIYWKIPHYNFLLATVCNQFNKSLFEDESLPQVIKELLSTKRFEEIDNIIDIKFVCHPIDDTQKMIEETYLGLCCAPPIYTIPLPNGNENPFISDYTRINIKDIQEELEFHILIYCRIEDNFTAYDIDVESDLFNEVMDVMISKYCEYFEGDDIPGWKNQHRKVDKSTYTHERCLAGYDPAL